MKASDLGVVAARALACLFLVLGLRGVVGFGGTWLITRRYTGDIPIDVWLVQTAIPGLYFAFAWLLWTLSPRLYAQPQSPAAADLLRILLRSLGVYYAMTTFPRLIAEISTYRYPPEFQRSILNRPFVEALVETSVLFAASLVLIFLNKPQNRTESPSWRISSAMLSSVLMSAIATYVLLLAAPDVIGLLITSSQSAAFAESSDGPYQYRLIRAVVACFGAVMLIGFHLINLKAAEGLQSSTG
jgi:hypothetical protein